MGGGGCWFRSQVYLTINILLLHFGSCSFWSSPLAGVLPLTEQRSWCGTLLTLLNPSSPWSLPECHSHRSHRSHRSTHTCSEQTKADQYCHSPTAYCTLLALFQCLQTAGPGTDLLSKNMRIPV